MFLEPKNQWMAKFHSIFVCEIPLSLLKLVTLKIFKNSDSQKLLHLCFSCFTRLWGPFGSVLPHRFTFFWPGRTWLLPSRKWYKVSRWWGVLWRVVELGEGFPFLQGRSTGWSRCYEKIDRNDERILVFKGNLREGWVGLEVWGKLAVNLSYICRIFVCHHW